MAGSVQGRHGGLSGVLPRRGRVGSRRRVFGYKQLLWVGFAV